MCWERPPAGAQHTLYVYISRLRKTLEPAAGRPVVLTRPGAYVLRATSEHIDAGRFERLAGEGRRALAEGAPGRAAAVLQEALTLWRGPPLADVSDEPFAQAEIARLEELRSGVLEDRIEAECRNLLHRSVFNGGCTAEFLENHLGGEQADILLRLWTYGENGGGQYNEMLDLYTRYGSDKISDAVMNFHRHRDLLRRYCAQGDGPTIAD